MNIEVLRLQTTFLRQLRRSPDSRVLIPSSVSRALRDDLYQLEAHGLMVRVGELWHCLCPLLLDKGITSLEDKLALPELGGDSRQYLWEHGSE